MSGKVVSKRFLRPKLSMVKNAGRAKSQFMTPNPREADRALIGENFASRKISDE